ncbi:hypothetical protein Ddye_000277 [Dipteronia dyeriana]|uniref:C3H1-type domain-containing protein n=1 Tax=Dipteronia dyeriana TaxID=168575 RepID=A0AAD9XMN2_9ROSI|nr:hypothetical protein Ddye_000277 [Dipteronia dyeriana]
MRAAINPPPPAIVHPIITSPASSLNIGVVNPAASIYQTIDPRLAQQTLGVGPTIYPQRPGQMECDFYMKTGECKCERCRFRHPIDRSAPTLHLSKLLKSLLCSLVQDCLGERSLGFPFKIYLDSELVVCHISKQNAQVQARR